MARRDNVGVEYRWHNNISIRLKSCAHKAWVATYRAADVFGCFLLITSHLTLAVNGRRPCLWSTKTDYSVKAGSLAQIIAH